MANTNQYKTKVIKLDPTKDELLSIEELYVNFWDGVKLLEEKNEDSLYDSLKGNARTTFMNNILKKYGYEDYYVRLGILATYDLIHKDYVFSHSSGSVKAYINQYRNNKNVSEFFVYQFTKNSNVSKELVKNNYFNAGRFGSKTYEDDFYYDEYQTSYSCIFFKVNGEWKVCIAYKFETEAAKKRRVNNIQAIIDEEATKIIPKPKPKYEPMVEKEIKKMNEEQYIVPEKLAQKENEALLDYEKTKSNLREIINQYDPVVELNLNKLVYSSKLELQLEIEDKVIPLVHKMPELLIRLEETGADYYSIKTAIVEWYVNELVSWNSCKIDKSVLEYKRIHIFGKWELVKKLK